MSLLLLPLFLVMFCGTYAEECKQPAPIDNFSLKKFSGSWLTSAFDAQKLTNRYAKARCVNIHYHSENGENKTNNFNFDVIFGKNTTIFTPLEGTYYLPDPTKGYLIQSVKGQPIVYNLTVTCTDYTTFFAGYVCGQEETGQYSEYVILSFRDPAKYDEVTSQDLKKCFKDISTKQVKEIEKRDDSNCPVLKRYH